MKHLHDDRLTSHELMMLLALADLKAQEKKAADATKHTETKPVTISKLEPAEILSSSCAGAKPETKHTDSNTVSSYTMRAYSQRMANLDDGRLECLRCQHRWFKRQVELPTVCPKCKSPYWKTPRKSR